MPQLLKQKIILLVHLLPLAMYTLCNLRLISKEAKMGINFHFLAQHNFLMFVVDFYLRYTVTSVTIFN